MTAVVGLLSIAAACDGLLVLVIFTGDLGGCMVQPTKPFRVGRGTSLNENLNNQFVWQ